MITDLIEKGFVAKLEDLKDIIGRSVSSAERYVKQAIDSGYLSQQDWKESKHRAKNSDISKEERIKDAKDFLEANYEILRNDPGRNGRYIVQKKPFSFDSHSNFLTLRGYPEEPPVSFFSYHSFSLCGGKKFQKISLR